MILNILINTSLLYIFCLIYYSLSENIAYKYNNVSILPCQFVYIRFFHTKIKDTNTHTQSNFPFKPYYFPYNRHCALNIPFFLNKKINITVDNDLLFTSNFLHFFFQTYFSHISNLFSLFYLSFHCEYLFFVFFFFLSSTQTNNNNKKCVYIKKKRTDKKKTASKICSQQQFFQRYEKFHFYGKCMNFNGNSLNIFFWRLLNKKRRIFL